MSMPQFNPDIIIRELRQTLFCDVWIITLNFHLTLKGKSSREEFRTGCDTDPYQPCILILALQADTGIK